MRNLLPAVIAASTAFITIAGLSDSLFPEAQVVAKLFIEIVIVTAALALLLGLVNLLTVHSRRMIKFERGILYSGVTLVSAIAVIVIHALDLRTTDDFEISAVVFSRLQVALESALAGLIFFVMVYAAYRMMRDRVSITGCFFITTLMIVLLGWLPLQGLQTFEELRNWLMEVPVTAGARGLLLGVAIGTITVGMRVLIGQEKAFRED